MVTRGGRCVVGASASQTSFLLLHFSFCILARGEGFGRGVEISPIVLFGGSPNTLQRNGSETRGLPAAPTEQKKIAQTGILLAEETPREGTRPTP
jgi:hypothetical protein